MIREYVTKYNKIYTYIYILIVLLTVTRCYTFLQKEKVKYDKSLAQYELIYAPDAPQQTVFLTAAKHFGMQTTVITKLSSKGVTSVVLPQLRKHQMNGGTIQIEGSVPIEDVFTGIMNNQRNYVGGMIAVVIIFAYVLVGLSSKDVVTQWTIIYPVALILCVSVLYQFCTTCSGHDQRMYIISISGLLISASCGIAVFWFNLKLHAVQWGLLVLGALAPLMSVFNIMMDPKLCYACMISGGSAYFSAVAVGGFIIHHHQPQPQFARRLTAIVISCFLLTVFYIKTYSQPHETNNTLTNYIGHSANEYAISDMIQPYTCVMITNPACGTCKIAMRALTMENIQFTNVPVCTMANPSRCFKSSAKSVSTPTILVFDDTRKIIFQSYGWPMNQEMKDRLVRLIEKNKQ